MQLDKIIIQLRQRTPWEAMDLGVMLVRQLWPVIFIPWVIMLSLVTVFVIAIQLQGYWYFSILLMWWIKPVYESMLLFIFSRSLFAEYPGVSDVYRDPGKWFNTGFLTSVLLWRFSPARSFNMPVNLLEGLSGKARKQRLQILHRVGGGHAMGLTVIGIHFEYVLALTLYILIFFIAPDSMTDYLQSVATDTDQTAWFIFGTVIYAIILFVLEPLYVAAGFMLYINRRTQLEGWDIELNFRQIANRLVIQSDILERVS